MNESELFTWISVALILIFGLVSPFIGELILLQNEHQYKNVTVVDKYVKRYDNTDKFFIVIKMKNNEIKILENRDSITNGKFNSADLQAEIKVNETYNIYSYGYRIHFLSMFENIKYIERGD